MLAAPGPTSPSSISLDEAPRELDLQYPVWLASMGLVLAGSWALLRLVLPNHPMAAYGIAPFISMGVWRFGPRPKPTSTLRTVGSPLPRR